MVQVKILLIMKMFALVPTLAGINAYTNANKQNK